MDVSCCQSQLSRIHDFLTIGLGLTSWPTKIIFNGWIFAPWSRHAVHNVVFFWQHPPDFWKHPGVVSLQAKKRMTEKLNSIEKRKLIDQFLEQVMQASPDLYYAPTAAVARKIHDHIQLQINRLPIEEPLLIKNVSIRELEIILNLY